jgi:two-component system, NtrC family, nitrogen regulation response regulator NtrX
MNGAAAQPTVLVLDDEKNIRRAIEIALEPEGMHVISAHDTAAALRVLHERIVDLMILDIKLGEVDGLTFFRKMQQDGFTLPVIFISGNASLTEAAQAVKLGAFDFLEKPFGTEKIVVLARRCLEFSTIKERLRLIEAQHPATEIIGDSAAIHKVVADALKVAATNANVLITGESGTGKELVANSIHARSERCGGPFVKVNCSAIPEGLLESELFGHESGAFTGAHGSRKGLFEVAHRGVIFLDEVADLSLTAQAKILRVVQSGELQRVGSEKPIRVDVRVLSGTHKDLKKCVAEGRFREDLFYRLNVVPIRVPSLRERSEDIPLLVQFFARRLCEKNNIREKPIEDDVMTELKGYHWPGNVRELQNVMERIIIMSGAVVTTLDLPEEVVAGAEMQPERSGGSALRAFRDSAERDFILATLKRHNGNISQSAIELGVGRTYLHRRLLVLKISRKDWLT